MFNIFKQKYWPIALDIGSESVRMIQFRDTGQGARLVAHDEWRFPEAIRNNASAQYDAVVKHVRHAIRHGGFLGRHVVTALPSEAIMIQNLRMPVRSAGTLEKDVRARAAEITGQPLVDGQFNYIVAGDIRGKDSGTREQEIIAMTTPVEVVQKHLDMLGDIGVSPTCIELDITAMFHVFEQVLRRQEDEAVVTVALDMGVKATRIIVASGDRPLFLKSIDIGGDDFTRAVASQANLEFSQAAELRRNSAEQFDTLVSLGAPDISPRAGGSNAESVFWTLRDAMRGPLGKLAKEIGLCLRYCAVTFRGVRPNQIHLCGGQARDGLIVRLLTEVMNVDYQILDPFNRFDTSVVTAMGSPDIRLPDWAVCVGLAFGAMKSQKDRKGGGYESCRLSA